jgi:hypothetical protein
MQDILRFLNAIDMLIHHVKEIKTVKYLSNGYFSCIVLADVTALNNFSPLENVSTAV